MAVKNLFIEFKPQAAMRLSEQNDSDYRFRRAGELD
jgi:hypothetical protein